MFSPTAPTPHLTAHSRLAGATPRRRTARALAAALSIGLVAAGCGSDSGESGTSGGTVDVVTGFYAAQFLAEAIGGDLVSVRSLTPPGAEPHDVELTPDAVIAVADADLVITLPGFQAAVDEAAKEASDGALVDLTDAVSLLELGEHEHEHEESHAGTDDAAADDHGHDHGHGAVDYHFWLDPERVASAAHAITEALITAAPDHRAAFESNRDELVGRLDTLGDDFSTGLAECEAHTIVTSHTAFGYLAAAYGLEQRGISGLSPEDEPTPAALTELTEFVRDNGVTTIFFETLTSPAIAETLANESGATTAVLDPLEGLTDESAGEDYFSIMRSNLEALRTGLTCR